MQTTTDEPLDIRELTYQNLDPIATLTRRDRGELEREMTRAHSNQRKVFVLVNNPLFQREKTKRERQQACDYDHKWSEETGWSQICIVHGKPTWHNLFSDPDAPCTAIDPKPEDI